MSPLADVVAVAMLGVTAGTYVNGVLVLLPAQRRLAARSYIEQEQANTALGTTRYRALIVATTCVQLAALHSQPDARPRILTATSILTVGVTTALVTVRRVVPINVAIRGWDPGNPPSDWSAVRTRWHQLHAVRTAGFTLALVLQIFAATDVSPRMFVPTRQFRPRRRTARRG